MSADQPPGYTSQPTPTSTPLSENSFSLQDSNGRKWLTLVVKSRSHKPQSSPLFFEGDVISGRVELNLDKSKTIKGVSVTVQGCTTSVGQDEILFLELKQDLWTPAMGSSSGGNSPTSTKLRGVYAWPFSIVLPSEVKVSEGKSKEAIYPLPSSFSERASPSYIDFRLLVTVKRSALTVNQTLSTNFGYFPIVYAGPPSPLRQIAYREGSALIGPDGDPEGWHITGPVKIKGTLFDSREVEVECSLAIATPLCYALGSPLPVILTLTSTDNQALDVLSAPSACRLHLIRSLANGSDATCDAATRRSSNFFSESVSQASFWPSTEGAREDFKRTLHGELEIHKGMKPSFTFPRLTIRYTLNLLAFDTPGFTSATDDPLLIEKVTIVSSQAPGIVARSHIPPGYDHKPKSDYNKSVGLLENGNQRFYQHHGTGFN